GIDDDPLAVLDLLHGLDVRRDVVLVSIKGQVAEDGGDGVVLNVLGDARLVQALAAFHAGYQDLPRGPLGSGLDFWVRVGKAGFLGGPHKSLDEFGRAVVAEVGGVVFEGGDGRGPFRQGARLQHRSRRRPEVQLAPRPVAQLGHGRHQVGAVFAQRAHEQQVGVRLPDAEGDRGEVRGAQVIGDVQDNLQALFLGHPDGPADSVAAVDQELRGREAADDEGHWLGRGGSVEIRVEHNPRGGDVGVEAGGPRHELPVVYVVVGQALGREGQDVPVAVGYPLRRYGGRGAVRPDQEVDPFRRDQAFVAGRGLVARSLVVQQHPFHRAPQESAALVQQLHELSAGDRVDLAGGGQTPRQRQGAADADGGHILGQRGTADAQRHTQGDDDDDEQMY